MKKIINVLIAVLMIACLAVTFTACNKPCAENEHDWQTLEVTKEATCKEEGSEKVKCAKCNEESTRVIPKTDHKASDIVDIPAIDADCGNAGSHGGKKCNLCGTVTVQPTTDPATGNHNYEGQTYLQDGDKHYQKCKVCGADGPKADHVYDQTGDKCVCGKLDPAVIATIGSVNYKSLSEAVAAGGEITLIKDVAITSTITVTNTSTINLNGHNIILVAQSGEEYIHMFVVDTNGVLTFKGNGNVHNEHNLGYVISVKNNGQVTIENGNYYATDSTVVQLNHTATAIIKGGMFAVKGEDEYGTRYVLNKIDSARDSAVFEVMGGSFTNFDPSNSPSEDPAQSFLADGYAVIEKDGVYKVINEKFITDFETTEFDEVVEGQSYYLIGEVKEFGTGAALTFGNFYIKDYNGNEFYIYGLYNEDGTIRYDAMKNKPKVGDMVVLYGEGSIYDNKIQLKNARLVELNGIRQGTAEMKADSIVVEQEVTADFTLSPLATWTSNNSAIEINGTIATVTRGDSDVIVTLTATVSDIYGGSATRTFTVKVLKDDGSAPVESYKLVSDVSLLAVGDKVIIVSKGDGYAVAMSTTQNKNNRAKADITISGISVSTDEVTNKEVQIFELTAGSVANTFAFKCSNGGTKDNYLYAASSSSNYLKSGTLNENASWKIEIDASGNATVKAQGTNTRNWMRYNSATTNGQLFSCYANGQQNIQIYKLSV